MGKRRARTLQRSLRCATKSRQAQQRRSVVGDRRDDERDRREREDAARRERDERRSDELREAWRVSGGDV